MVKHLFAFLILVSLFTCQLLFSQQHILFNYSLENGLPQSSVISIYQDLNGNMWFGTQGGVCKYNGNTFENFDTRHGLGDNHISAICQDKSGRYWFGHRYKGLTTMHGNAFRHYNFTNQQVTSIHEDNYGNMWIGTLHNGLYLLTENYDEANPEFLRCDMQFDFQQTTVNCIVKGRANEIVVGSWNGLVVFNSSSSLMAINYHQFTTQNSNLPFKEIISIAKESDDVYWLLGFTGLAKIRIKGFDNIALEGYYSFDDIINVSSLNNIVIDANKTIWGTCDKGMYKFEGEKFDFDFTGTGYHETTTYCIFYDKEKNIWIGTMDLGVFKFTDDRFMVYDRNSGLLNNVVTSVVVDKSDNIWIATEGGICVYDGKKYKYFTNKNGIPNKSMNCVFEDSHGYIWIGNVANDPLFRYNPETGLFRKFGKNDGIPTNSVITINEDDEGNVWFASLYDTPFRYTYPVNGQTEIFQSFSKADGLCSNSFWIIHKDLMGNLWFGSDDAGLSKYDGKNFTTYNNKDGLAALSIGAVTNDSRNNLWIGSIGGGIFKFDGKKFTNYNIGDGLSSDSPFSIICDDNDNVWIGTNTGIDKFDPIYKTFKHYGKSEGFTGIENNQNSIFKGDDGIIWFGTIHGLIRFNPELDQINKIPPVTVIEKINLFYNEFNYSIYTDSIDSFSGLPVGLKLNYHNNHLSFNYVGISHVAPDRITYRYKLENFDKSWNPVSRATSATYTNIPPGKYTFKVKAANIDGVWDSQPAIMEITILPPIWQTAWFRIIAVFFLGGVIYLIFWWRLRSIKTQKAKLERSINEKTVELQQEAEERRKAQLKAEESDKLKTSFLANMSHEIRTPVNAIVGFADLLKDKNLNEEEKGLYLSYIIGGGKSLLNLINDIIDISKIEAGQIRISHDVCNVCKMFSELFMTFNEELKKRNKQNIELSFNILPGYEKLEIFTDPYRLKQVLNNLIANAIKFTDQGSIVFGFSMDETQRITFYVKDSGIGIPADKLEVIFERFRQVEESYTRNFEGTGLGLAISKKLTYLMGGEMWVESTQGEGSSFYFSIPFEPVGDIRKIVKPAAKLNGNALSDKTILLVEDEHSNYLLVDSMLNNNNNRLIHVTNGFDALETFKTMASEIDFILMDIKIPGINGYEATREIKEIKPDVPIIAQTAYAISGERDKCIEAGCDDYIAKPYNKAELLSVILNNIPASKYDKVKVTQD